MTVSVYLLGDDATLIWELTGRERLQRMLDGRDDVSLLADWQDKPAHDDLIIINTSYLIDPRLITALIQDAVPKILTHPDGAPVAIRIAADQVLQQAPKFLAADLATLSQLPRYTPETLPVGLQAKLKKKDLPYVLHIEAAEQAALEQELFSAAYKSVTDLVTKWWWPKPALLATRWCVKRGITPNQVTLCGLALTILAGFAFAYGFYALGLVMGWIMTFLDTVDGKLARVTVTSSKHGDILDHGIDLIHPPFWYLAWGLGLTGTTLAIPYLPSLMILLLIGYIGGRLCEAAFHIWAGPFTIFMWRPFDSINRLITARRNPNMIMLTLSWVLGRPDIGFYLVVVWHLLSTLILAVRVLWGCLLHRKQPVESWLDGIDIRNDQHRLSVRWFTRLPYQQ
ncbi:MAG: CDP-alcohol phosphatidyltransferase family protein [Methylococcales bacterium]|nr:CDP-alcohol phosphatidyltransferase family protein [Methylococcales bacterium]